MMETVEVISACCDTLPVVMWLFQSLPAVYILKCVTLYAKRYLIAEQTVSF